MRNFPWLLLVCAVSLPAQQAAPKDGVTVPITVLPPASVVVEPDRVVLQVGDIKVTARQLDALVEVYPTSTQVFARGPGKDQFADTVVRMLVLSEEARKRKLNETERFKDQLRFSEANLLANTLGQMLPDEIKPDEAALRKYYDAHRCEYATWKARHILVRFKGSPIAIRAGQPDVSEEEALMRAKQIRQQIAGGADFAELAKTESDDVNSGVRGGDMGEIRHGQVVPSLEEAVCAMNPGEISQPVKTAFGYHVIRMESKDAKDFQELKGDLEPKYRAEAAKKMIDDLIAKTKVIKDKEYYAPPDVKDVEIKKP
jgi:peptidyl-prolyl cis-trans isomerase C